MILNSIMSNVSSGISGAAAKTKDAAKSTSWRQLLGNKDEYNAAIDAMYAKRKEEGKSFTGIGAFAHKNLGNQIGADYKGEGWKRTGVVSARQAAGLAIGIPVEGAFRYATGSGGFTHKDGERDIAGIPFI